MTDCVYRENNINVRAPQQYISHDTGNPMINAAAIALVTLSAPATASPDAVTPEVATANVWLDQLDTKRWNENWNGTGKLFQSNLTQEQWVKTAQAVREPLGAVISRQILGVTKTTTLPGAPDGVYGVLTYSTAFTNKASAVETVVLARDGEQWKIVGYFIR
jgi:peptidoglycan hydrolase-like protein with peptidoglycan-binding domain